MRIVAANPPGPAPERETVFLLNASPRAVDLKGWQLGPVILRERVEGQQVVLGGLEQFGDLGRRAGELVDDLAEPFARLQAVGGMEERRIAPETSGCCVLATWPSMSRVK